MNALDRALAYVSPTRALERVRARRTLELIDGLQARRFDGASKGRRLRNWRAPASDGTTAAATGRATLRQRARDLARNSPWANRAQQILASNVIGTGIRPQARPMGTSTREAAEQLDRRWAEWAGSTQCDADGRLDFYGLQSLVLRTVAESGDCLVRLRRRRSSTGLALPIQLQVLEPDYLDTTKDTDRGSGEGWIEQGIEFNSRGQRVAYWILKDHPGAYRRTARATDSVRVPASQVSHVYRPERPGQTIGQPWCSPVIVALRDLQDYHSAELVKQKIASLWGAFITRNDPDGAPAHIDSDGQAIEELQPGMVEYLEPGESINFPQTPKAEGFGEYTKLHLRAVAAVYGLTYEQLTGDFSSVNFSSGRMGWIESGRFFEATRRHLLIPQFCAPVWSWFCDACAVTDGMSTDGVGVTWTAPRREMIDPTREVPAQITAIRGGLMTLSEALRRSGYDPEEVLEERARDDRWIDELGVVVECDPRPRAGDSVPASATPGDVEEDGDDQAETDHFDDPAQATGEADSEE